MTLEHEARALLAQIAETQEWAQEDYSRLPAWENLLGVVPLFDLEVAAWRATVWLATHWCRLEALFDRWSTWQLSGYRHVQIGGFEADPRIAVFKAVLELLSKEPQ